MDTQSLVSYQSPLGRTVEIVRQTFPAVRRRPVKRISFVAGLHGNELEGIYICCRILAYLRRLQETHPGSFQGEVHVYPTVNPQAAGTASRLWPFFSVDMNRQMGDPSADSLPASASRQLLDDLKTRSDLVVDFHASNLQLKELPQIRIIDEFKKKLVPLASRCNTDLIWVHPMSPVFESTLGYNLNREKIPTLVVETGICLRLHQDFCEQIFQGMVHLLHHTGILALPEAPPPVKDSRVVQPDQVGLVQAKYPGLFISRVTLGSQVKRGDPLGEVLDPVTSEVREEVRFPADGLLFTLREHPVTYPGAPLARVALAIPDQP